MLASVGFHGWLRLWTKKLVNLAFRGKPSLSFGWQSVWKRKLPLLQPDPPQVRIAYKLSTMATLSDILDEDLLCDLAGEVYFDRGVHYFEQGRVRDLAQYDEHITAEVIGTETYQVHLWLQDHELLSRCSCPLGVDGLFCKHCVAVGLAWIDEPPPYRPAGDAPAKMGTTMDDVRQYLARQEHDTLVQMILNQAMEDSTWREKLLMRAASSHPGGADINTFRRALQNAITTGDFVDYYEAASYAEAVQNAVDGLEDLLDQGYASEVVELSEEAIRLLEDALNHVDDSDGNLNLIMDQLPELHHQACEVAHPDPRALATRLFHLELESGFGFFTNALATYADILGDEGRAAYRQLVDAEWQKLPAISRQNNPHFDYRHHKLRRMKESLVAAMGDLDELVAVMAQDLSQPSRYLQIAQLYDNAGQIEEAIHWAEDGLEAFQDSYTGQLGDFLVAAYEQQGRYEEAIDIVWQDFSRSPSLHLYQKLQQQAEKADAWDDWREEALALIRDKLQDPDNQRTYSYRYGQTGYSLLVEILLWEGDVDQAWREAQQGGCNPTLWQRLAELRAAEHPEDALAVYSDQIEPLINQTNNDAYRHAIELLLKVKTLMVRLDRKAEFEESMARLKAKYRRKRNFIKFLNLARLG